MHENLYGFLMITIHWLTLRLPLRQAQGKLRCDGSGVEVCKKWRAIAWNPYSFISDSGTETPSAHNFFSYKKLSLFNSTLLTRNGRLRIRDFSMP
jgi:hypothetical protein